MASIRRRKGARTWEVVWDIEPHPETGARRQRSKSGFRTKRDAQSWNARREVASEADEREPSKLTVAEYYALWLAGHSAYDATLHNYEQTLRLWIAPYIGDIPLAKLHKSDIIRWHRDMLGNDLSPNTVRYAHSLLSAVITEAVKIGDVRTNVLLQVKKPLHVKPERTVWDEDQLGLFIAALAHEPPDMALFWELILFTQIRPGEAMGLRWQDVNWQRGTIQVAITRTRNRQGKQILGKRTKTPSSHRTIPLTPAYMDRLRLLRRSQEQHAADLVELWQDHGLIFPRGDGRMLSQSTLQFRIKRVCKQAGVPLLTPHELRHTGATILIARNENIKVISERLGHKSIATTLDLYGHVSPGMQQDLSDRIAEWFGQPRLADDRILESNWEQPADDPE